LRKTSVRRKRTAVRTGTVRSNRKEPVRDPSVRREQSEASAGTSGSTLSQPLRERSFGGRQLVVSAGVAALVAALVAWGISRPAGPRGAVPPPAPTPTAAASVISAAPAASAGPGAPVQLQQDLAGLRRKIVQLENDLNSALRITVTDLSSNRVAVLDATRPKYATMMSGSGMFVVLVQSFEPAGDGFVLHLQLGNPTSMIYTGFTLKVRCGETNVHEFKRPEVLAPGHWLPLDIPLTPARAEELNALEMSIETNRVELYK
jgi:hypothetical protein